MQKEIWKDVEGYEGYYQVSDYGRVKSLDRLITQRNYKRLMRGKILRPTLDGHGYHVYGLSKKGKVKNYRSHVLVAMAFLNHKPNGFELVVDHKDDDPSNNNVDNIQIVTHRYNISKSKRGNSKYTGVCWHKGKEKWISSIFINGKLKHIGYFNCETQAHLEYQKELINEA